MRKVNIETNKYTEVYAIDKKEFNANHEYQVKVIAPQACDITEDEVFAKIKFQKGPVKENGVNGCQNEDLINIVLDRLDALNQGVFKCRENSIAITKLEEALMWLRRRTYLREIRGVEGTSQE